MKHRMTIQFDAHMWFDLELPPDDARLIRERTPVSVVVEPSDTADDCSQYALKIRVGTGPGATDYEQARFVHKSAAVGCATCLLQYLRGKPQLNVTEALDTPEGPPTPVDRQSFVAVGWTMAKIEASHVVAKHSEHVRP